MRRHIVCGQERREEEGKGQREERGVKVNKCKASQSACPFLLQHGVQQQQSAAVCSAVQCKMQVCVQFLARQQACSPVSANQSKEAKNSNQN